MPELFPVFVLTGFLGSGKTTLLQRFLRSPEGEGTGIVVNEFGQAAVDHRLLVHAKEQVELLSGGCLCCTRRADIAASIGALLSSAGRGMRRVVIETSGLADPAPIVATLARDAWMRAHARLAGVVTVVDAVAGLDNFRNHPEALRQVAMADTVVVTKTDLGTAMPIAEMQRAIERLAPDAALLDGGAPEFSPAMPFAGTSWRTARGLFADGAAHGGGVTSFALPLPETLDWPCFTVWLSALLHAHGDRILRVKGCLRSSGSAGLLAIHGVQHVMHPPTHLGDDDGVATGLVFITRGIGREVIERSLRAFQHLGAAVPA